MLVVMRNRVSTIKKSKPALSATMAIFHMRLASLKIKLHMVIAMMPNRIPNGKMILYEIVQVECMQMNAPTEAINENVFFGPFRCVIEFYV